ncbi:glycoside hydrolase family 5 protein [Myxococcota bacterium]
MKRLFLLLALTMLPACGETETTVREYFVEDGVLVNSSGEALYLRSINVHESAKYHPDHIIPLTPDEVSILQDSGFNSVRLLTHWEAVMPESGRVDRDYLAVYLAEVQKLTDAGLLVVVDMHQDVWGDPFGNGAPGWACPDELKEGYTPVSPWWMNYFEPQVEACFDLFWSEESLQDSFAGAWQEVAAAVCGNRAVVGFDLINEPWPGSSLSDATFDDKILYRFYRRIMNAIEEVCPGRVFFLEPSRGYDFELIDPIQFDDPDRRRVVLAPHFYPPAVHEPGRSYDGDAAALEEAWLKLYQPFLDDGVPMWFGEFGGLTSNPGSDLYLEHITSIFYEHFAGSALWAFSYGDEGFSFLDSAGRRKTVFDPVCSVPSPVRLPSAPTAMIPDFETPGLTLEFSCRRRRQLAVRLPAGYDWTFSSDPADLLSADQTCTDDGQVRVDIIGTPNVGP